MCGSRCVARPGARLSVVCVLCCAALVVFPGARLVAPECSQIAIYNHISGIIPNRVKIALIIDINQ